jgi:hypothetical protein
MRIKLTTRQVELLRPYIDRVKAAAVMGSPGMLVAQIGSDHDGEYAITPAFLDHDLAKQITERGRDLPRLEKLKEPVNGS